MHPTPKQGRPKGYETNKDTSKDSTKKDEGVFVKSGQGKSKKRDSSVFFPDIVDYLDGFVACKKNKNDGSSTLVVFQCPP